MVYLLIKTGMDDVDSAERGVECRFDERPPSTFGVSLLNRLRVEGTVEALREKFIDYCAPNERRMILDWRDSGYDTKRFPQVDNSAMPDKIIDMIVNTNDMLFFYNYDSSKEYGKYARWIYMIDLEQNTLEVYAGQNCMPLARGERFYTERPPRVFINGKKMYQPRLVAYFSLDKLPTVDEFACILGSDFHRSIPAAFYIKESQGSLTPPPINGDEFFQLLSAAS